MNLRWTQGEEALQQNAEKRGRRRMHRLRLLFLATQLDLVMRHLTICDNCIRNSMWNYFHTAWWKKNCLRITFSVKTICCPSLEIHHLIYCASTWKTAPQAKGCLVTTRPCNDITHFAFTDSPSSLPTRQITSRKEREPSTCKKGTCYLMRMFWMCWDGRSIILLLYSYTKHHKNMGSISRVARQLLHMKTS